MGDMSAAHDTIPHIVDIYLAARQRTRADLAAYMNITPSVISKKMSGRSRITADDIEAFAAFLDVSPAMFFEDPATLVRNRWFLPTLVGAP